MIKKPRLTRAQWERLRAAHEHGDITYGLVGRAAHGGLNSTRCALQRMGLIDERCNITKEGRQMLQGIRTLSEWWAAVVGKKPHEVAGYIIDTLRGYTAVSNVLDVEDLTAGVCVLLGCGAAMTSTADFDTRLWSQYLGVVTLLGNIAKHLPRGHEDRYGIDKAMRDANNVLLVRESTIRFVEASGGGYAPFEVAVARTTEATSSHNPSAKRAAAAGGRRRAPRAT